MTNFSPVEGIMISSFATILNLMAATLVLTGESGLDRNWCTMYVIMTFVTMATDATCSMS
jgi:hypothetical protein